MVRSRNDSRSNFARSQHANASPKRLQLRLRTATMTDHLTELTTAAQNPAILTRFRAKIHRSPDLDCWLWTGAISGKGHGRFWIRDDLVVIAHRFAWLVDQLDHGHAVTAMPAVISHDCDNPICQNPAHLRVGTATSNRREWAARRTVPGSPLRDLRGARGRAIALRNAAKTRADLAAVIDDGLGDIDHFQDQLW